MYITKWLEKNVYDTLNSQNHHMVYESENLLCQNKTMVYQTAQLTFYSSPPALLWWSMRALIRLLDSI